MAVAAAATCRARDNPGDGRRRWVHHQRPMARVVFTPQLRRYVLDDQGHMRVNVVAFIDGRRCDDRVGLNDPLGPESTVHVLQALSGG